MRHGASAPALGPGGQGMEKKRINGVPFLELPFRSIYMYIREVAGSCGHSDGSQDTLLRSPRRSCAQVSHNPHLLDPRVISQGLGSDIFPVK